MGDMNDELTVPDEEVTELSPEVVEPVTTVTKSEVRERADKLLDPFAQCLQEVDETNPKFKLATLWSQCLKVHDENAMLRANMMQQEFFLQDMAKQWTQLRRGIGIATGKLDPNDPEYLRKLTEFQLLNAALVKNIGTVTKTITAIRKEIRTSEMQDKLRLPVSIVNMMIGGLTGILHVELQGEPKRLGRILHHIQKLSAAMGMLHQIGLSEDEDPPLEM